MNTLPSAMYIRGVRVSCLRIDPKNLTPEAQNADSLMEECSAPILMTRLTDSAPDGWITIPRGYARPRPAEPEPLEPLCSEHFPAMRGLYGLSAGRFNGMLAREDPAEWATRLSSLHHPLGLFKNGRLLLWLDARDGDLVELSAAPDAYERIPGALTAAGITRAPAPLLGVPAEENDQTLKLRLLRPFLLFGERIETTEQLARAMEGVVQWD